MNNKEFLITVSVKNNLLFKAIRDAGYKTVAEFCIKNNLCQSTVGRFINFKQNIYKKNGDLLNDVVKICEVLNKKPSELFTESQNNYIEKKTLEVDREDMETYLDYIESHSKDNNLLENIIDEEEKEGVLDKVLDTLTPREVKIIKHRFGIEEESKTLDEISKIFEVSKDRIRQIEQRALRKMSHPSRSDELKKLL